MKKLRLVAAIMTFILFSFPLMGQATQELSGDNAPVTREHVAKLLQWLNAVGRFEKISQQDIAMHFATKFKYYINGKLEATNNNNLHQRYMVAKNYYKSAYIHFPIKDIIVDGNKAAARYLVTFIDKNGVHKDTGNTVIITFNKVGKVIEFSQAFDTGAPLS